MVLFWKSLVNITVEDSTKNFIDAYIDKNIKNEWRFIGFYGEPKTAHRHEAWSKLRCLKHHSSIPWLGARDFNEIKKQEEKLGGAIRPHNQMQLF